VGKDTNLEKNTPGYVALFGQIDVDGSVVEKGLLDQADFVQPLQLSDGDLLAFKQGGKYLIFVAEQDRFVFTGEDRFAQEVNFVGERDPNQAGSFRLHSFDGTKKIAVEGGQLLLVATNDVADVDFFEIEGTAEALTIGVPGSAGEIFVSDDQAGDVSLAYEQGLDSTHIQADLAEKGRFSAVLVGLGGSVQTSEGKELAEIVIEAMDQDQSASEDVLSDVKKYLAENVDDVNMNDWSGVVQQLVSELEQRPESGFFDHAMLDGLTEGVSIFEIKGEEAAFFVRNQEGLLLQVGDGVDSGEAVEVQREAVNIDGNVTIVTEAVAKQYFPLETAGLDAEKAARNVFKFVPSVAIEGAYEIIGYSVDGVGGRSLEMRNGELGFYERSMFEVAGRVSPKENQLFKVFGTQGAVIVRTLQDESLSVPFDGRLQLQVIDSFNQGLLFEENEFLAAILYDAGLDLYFDPDLSDSDRTQSFEKYLLSFQKLVVETDVEGQEVVKDEILGVQTDLEIGTISIEDLVIYIREDLTYSARRRKGIRFSPATEEMLEQWAALAVKEDPADYTSITEENILAIVKPDGDYISSLIANYQITDQDKVRAYVQRIASFVAGEVVYFVSDVGYALASWEGVLLRGGLTEDQRTRITDALQLALDRDVIDQSTNVDLLATLEAVIAKVAVPAKAYDYEKMKVYDNLELAENMIYGRYTNFDGLEMFEINLEEAQKILGSITEEEINGVGLKEAQSYRDWKRELQGYIDFLQALNDEKYSKYKASSVPVRKKILAGSIQVSTNKTAGLSFGGATVNPVDASVPTAFVIEN
jgi:hypothetical protein